MKQSQVLSIIDRKLKLLTWVLNCLRLYNKHSITRGLVLIRYAYSYNICFHHSKIKFSTIQYNTIPQANNLRFSFDSFDVSLVRFFRVCFPSYSFGCLFCVGWGWQFASVWLIPQWLCQAFLEVELFSGGWRAERHRVGREPGVDNKIMIINTVEL